MMQLFINQRYKCILPCFMIISLIIIGCLLGCSTHSSKKGKEAIALPKANSDHYSVDSTQPDQTVKSSKSVKKPAKPSRPQYMIIQSPQGPLSPIPMREKPQANSKILSRLEAGARLEILDKQNFWIKVKTQDGKKGWINLYNLSK